MSSNISFYEPMGSNILTYIHDLAAQGGLVDPDHAVLRYLGLTLDDARTYNLAVLKKSPIQDDDSFVGLCVLRTRDYLKKQVVLSASVCKKGRFSFTLLPGTPDIAYVPHSSLRRDKPFLIFRTELAAILASKQVGDAFNVIMLPSLCVDRPLWAALQRSSVTIFDDELYNWGDTLRRYLPHAVSYPLLYGKDFAEWILHLGGNVSDAHQLALQASKTSHPEYYFVSKYLGEECFVSPAASQEIENVREMRDIIKTHAAEPLVSVHITEGEDADEIEISYGSTTYTCRTDSSQILRDLPPTGVVSPDCYTQRKLFLRHGYRGILECTKLLQLAQGTRLVTHADSCLTDIGLPGRSLAESCFHFYQKHIREISGTPQQFNWYILMRDSQRALYRGAYRMRYNPKLYENVCLEIARYTDNRWLMGSSWVKAIQYGKTSLPINLHPCGSLSGRFSCTEPAMQSVPMELRKAFYSNECMVFVSGDLSQCELRILAAIADDKKYLSNFGGDPHRETASKIFGKASTDITSEERKVGKQVNLSIVYGIGNKALADNIGCSPAQARYCRQMIFIQRQIQLICTATKKELAVLA